MFVTAIPIRKFDGCFTKTANSTILSARHWKFCVLHVPCSSNRPCEIRNWG
jgi:hypothetical protein